MSDLLNFVEANVLYTKSSINKLFLLNLVQALMVFLLSDTVEEKGRRMETESPGRQLRQERIRIIQPNIAFHTRCHRRERRGGRKREQ